MKALLRKIARSLAGWPVVGRLVRIGVAVVRLPELRDRLELTLAPHAVTSGNPVFDAEQLPTLLQALSDMNQRQLSEANARENLVQSVPVALRKLTRDIVELREQNAGLQAQINTGSASADHAQLQQLSESVGYLLGRVEFVRRELMFEMRYGATSPGQGADKLKAESEILAADKVRQARTAGARVNLGCGHVPLDGYLNVDRRALPGVDIVAEVDALPFAKGELAEICSAHLLEHFPLEQLRRELLPYWTSLLRTGGAFRAIVPDGANMARAYASKEYTFENLRQITFGGQDYDGDFHYNMFSVDSLSQLLREAGFSKVDVIAENRENGGCKEFELVASL
jgi:predicted SAM-dependent methyltransferase